MKCKQVLEQLLDCFYENSDGLSWTFDDDTTIAEVCGKDIETFCLKVKIAAGKRNTKIAAEKRKLAAEKRKANKMR